MSYSWTYGVFLCKFAHYIQNVSAVCSVLTLTAMSIERSTIRKIFAVPFNLIAHASQTNALRL